VTTPTVRLADQAALNTSTDLPRCPHHLGPLRCVLADGHTWGHIEVSSSAAPDRKAD
jgi:hypothetical protein